MPRKRNTRIFIEGKVRDTLEELRGETLANLKYDDLVELISDRVEGIVSDALAEASGAVQGVLIRWVGEEG